MKLCFLQARLPGGSLISVIRLLYSDLGSDSLSDNQKHRNKRKDENDPYNLGDISDFLYDRFTVMSATECTGLIPSEPQTEEERENYEDIYDINQPKENAGK